MRISDWSSDVCSSDLHVEQDENAREAERNHDGKPLRCSLQAFELPAPFEIIARRELHIGNLRLPFRHAGPPLGSAPCRERACQYASLSAVPLPVTTTQHPPSPHHPHLPPNTPP